MAAGAEHVRLEKGGRGGGEAADGSHEPERGLQVELAAAVPRSPALLDERRLVDRVGQGVAR